MIFVPGNATIIGATFTEGVVLDDVVNVTLIGVTICDVPGSGLTIRGSHNTRIMGCRVLRCGQAGRVPAVLLEPGTGPSPVPNDTVIAAAHIENNYGVAIWADRCRILTICSGTKIHGRHYAPMPSSEDDQELLVVERGELVSIDSTVIFTGGTIGARQTLVRLPRDARFAGQWGARTDGPRHVVVRT